MRLLQEIVLIGLFMGTTIDYIFIPIFSNLWWKIPEKWYIQYIFFK